MAARFDDVRTGTAWSLPAPVTELVAYRPEDVVPVLSEVDQASARGWWAFGFVAYEAAAGLRAHLPVHRPMDGLPLVWFGIGSTPTRVPLVGAPLPGVYDSDRWVTDWTEQQHRAKVDAVRRNIAAGQTYQCNLTTALRGRLSGDLEAFYADLVLGQRGSYNAYLHLGRFVVASASPELFFDIYGRRLRMRPMKGTAPRGLTEVEDAAITRNLRSSAKERAENIMIVDLVRNDVARVAETGSVRVGALCQPERYHTVLQLTSEVTADLIGQASLTDIFEALFPCGSVTGAPKTATMQIIRDLEDNPRGVYCGAIGVVAPRDARCWARFNVAIRSVLVDLDTGAAHYGTGGGITWDSDPAAEYAELQAKAEVLTRLRTVAR